MSLYDRLLADPNARRIYLVEVDAYSEVGEGIETLRWGTEDFTTEPGDTPSNAYFEGRLHSAVDFVRALWSPERIGGASLPGFGQIVLDNADGGLDDLSGYRFDGRDVRVYLGGILGDGTELGFSDFGLVFAGTIAADAEIGQDFVRLALRDLQHLLDRQVCESTYRGFESAVACGSSAAGLTGANDYVTLGTVLDPTASGYTVQLRFFDSMEANKNTANAFQWLISNDDNVNGWGLRFRRTIRDLVFSTYNGGAVAGIGSAITLRSETWYDVAVVHESSGDIRFYVDGVLVNTSNVTYPPATTAAVATLGARATLGNQADMMFCEVRFWDRALTGDEIAANTEGPLEGTEADLRHYWRADEGAGTTLYDRGSGASNGTLVNNAWWGSSLEGGSALRGQRKRISFGKIHNLTPALVDRRKLVYQLNDGRIQGVFDVDDFGGVYDGGVALTEGVVRTSLMTFLYNTPAAGAFDVIEHFGLIRTGSTPAAQLTADFWGCSRFEGFRFDGTSDTFSIATGTSATQGADGDLTLEAYLAPSGDGTVFDLWTTGTAGILVEIVSGGIQVTTETGSKTSVEDLLPAGSLNPGEPFHLAIAFTTSGFGGSPLWRGYINGHLVAESAEPVSSLGSPNWPTTWYVGSTGGASGWFAGYMSEIRIWETARTAAQIAANCWRYLDPGDYPTWYYSRRQDAWSGGATVADWSGNVYNGTGAGGLTWGGAPAAASIQAAVGKIAEDMDVPSIDYASLAASAPPWATADPSAFPHDLAPGIGYVCENDQSALVALDAITSPFWWFGFDRASDFHIGFVSDPADAVAADVEILDDEVMSIDPIATPSGVGKIVLECETNWTQQDDGTLLGATSDERRDFVRQRSRSATKTISSTYLTARELTLITHLSSQLTAARAADYFLVLFGVPRRRFRVRTKTPGLAADLGTVVSVSWPRFGLDAGALFLVLGVTDESATNEAILEVWA